MNIVFSTGGTGGHINAALNLARDIREENPNLTLKFILNSNADFEKRLAKHGFNYTVISLQRPPSNLSYHWFSFLFSFIKAVKVSLNLISESKPDMVVGFGSYASLPMIIAQAISFRKIKVIIHEQNPVPGRATKIASFFACKVAVSFKDTKKYFRNKAVYTGNFIDSRFFSVSKKEALESLNLEKGMFSLLIMGGSQGAAFINNLIISTIKKFSKELREKTQFIHICGNKNYEAIKNKYEGLNIKSFKLIGFSEDMPLLLAASDLVISRAGATSIAEIAAAARASILIPYPYARGHQMYNALLLKNIEAAIVYEEREIDPEKLSFILKKMMTDEDLILKMSANCKKIAEDQASSNMKRVINNII
jgi:UDP-N-acetylglucosamine--N-acetylmuramyl-(pentapeptide) pyrophosphoryl-undecaprenol N-acetylglucosamine transferase